MKNENQFSIRIKEALDYKGLSARELSHLTNISESTISRYISGKVSPKIEYVKKIAYAMNLNVLRLAGFDVPMLNNNNTKEQIIRELDLMSEEDLSNTLTFIKTFIKRTK